MCIIIHDTRRGGEAVPREYFDRAFEINHHGVGLMYPEAGKLVVWKSMDDVSEAYAQYVAARACKVPVSVHFRLGLEDELDKDGKVKKLGNVSEANLHPFEIEPGRLAFMHNGTVKTVDKLLSVGQCDTAYIAEEVLQRLPVDFLDSPILDYMVHKLFDSGRVVFMDHTGKWLILNSNSWGAKWVHGSLAEGGLWMSKGDYIPYVMEGIKKPTKATSGDSYVYRSGNSFYDNDHDYRSAAGGKLPDGRPWYDDPQAWADYLTGEDDCEFDAEYDGDNAESQGQGVLTPLVDDTPPAKPANTKKSLAIVAKATAVSPTPARNITGVTNLIFDYGFMRTIGLFDDRIKAFSPGVLSKAQLWAIGAVGNSIGVPAYVSPSAVASDRCTIRGDVYYVRDKGHVRDVLAQLDAEHGCVHGDHHSSVYVRDWKEITLPSGSRITAWVYRYTVPMAMTHEPMVVPGGVWADWADKGAEQHYRPQPTICLPHGTVQKGQSGIHKCPKCTGKNTKVMSDTQLLCIGCDTEAIILTRGIKP